MFRLYVFDTHYVRFFSRQIILFIRQWVVTELNTLVPALTYCMKPRRLTSRTFLVVSVSTGETIGFGDVEIHIGKLFKIKVLKLLSRP